MKIKLLKLWGDSKPGDVVEVSDSTANKLIWRKLAEKAPDEPIGSEPIVEVEVETAESEPPPERAARVEKPKARRRGE